MGGMAAAASTKMIAGETSETADPSGRNHGLCQHTAAGMADVDAQASHERIDLLRYFEESDCAHEPDQDIS